MVALRNEDRTEQRKLVRHELLEVLIKFAEQHNGAVPTRRSWWVQARLKGYSMCQTTFDTHVGKLAYMDRLIEFRDGVIVINHSRWEFLKDSLYE